MEVLAQQIADLILKKLEPQIHEALAERIVTVARERWSAAELVANLYDVQDRVGVMETSIKDKDQVIFSQQRRIEELEARTDRGTQ